MAVAYNSPLVRRKWVAEGMIGQAHKSFWRPYIGNSMQSIIYVNSDLGCGLNSDVTFDFSGKLTGAGTEGMNEVCGIGEEDRKFSDSLKMRVFNWMTSGQLKTDACDINDLELYYHKGARGRLMDLYGRHFDQFIFDDFVGALGCVPTHIYNLGCSFEFNDIAQLSTAAQEGIGFFKPTSEGGVSATPADDRYPLEGFRLSDGKPVYLMVITTKMATALKSNPKYQTIMLQGDVRGNGNAILSGVIGEQENIVFVTAPVFAGVTKGKGKFNPITDTNITMSGLRRYAIGPDGVVVWQGQKAFRAIEKAAEVEKIAHASAVNALPEAERKLANATAGTPEHATAKAAVKDLKDTIAKARQYKTFSRGLLLGQAAGMLAQGTPADYQTEPTKFKRRYDSLLDVFFNFRTTNLTLEMGEDYPGASITDMTYGYVAVDMEE